MLGAAAALAACGGEDPADIEEVIRGWAKASNERDAKAFCNDYITQDFAERVTGASGKNAREQCEKLFDVTQPGLEIEIIEVSQIEIDGDEATVTAVIRRQGQRARQVYELVKDGGDWKLNGAR